MKRLLVLLGFLLLPANLSAHASAVDFSKWAVLIVAGDNRAQSGGPTQVFDNARKDLVKAFTGAGFAAANIEQFAVNHDNSARPAEIGSIAGVLWDLSSRAPAGCLIYFTSHGTPDGIGVGNAVVSPGKVAAMINNSCGDKPASSDCSSKRRVEVGGQRIRKLPRDRHGLLTLVLHIGRRP